MIKQVFLDLDGVITDFVGSAITYLNLQCLWEDLVRWDAIYDHYWGTQEEFWKELGDDFWENHMSFTTDAKEILKVVDPYEPCILTCPTPEGGSTGKQLWIKKNLPDYYLEGRYLIGPCKAAASRPGSVLIDDADHNIYDWSMKGGQGILVPRPWNTLGGERNAAETIAAKLKHYNCTLDGECILEEPWHENYRDRC